MEANVGSSIFELRSGQVKTALLVAVVVGGSAALGFFLERVFAPGFAWDLSVWPRLWPLVVSFLILASFLTVFSISSNRIWRMGGYILAAFGFGVPFFVAPEIITIPPPFPALLPLIYLGGLGAFDYYAQRAVKVYAVFASWMFSSVYAKFFFFLTLAVGILVYFSAQLPPQAQFEIPKEILNPSLNLVIDQVVGQVQSQMGMEQFNQDKFLEELKKSGVLQVLEEQFGVSLKEEQLTSPQKLTESLRGPLAERVTEDLEGMLEPYLPFLPLAAAVGVAFSILFLTPILAWLSVLSFAALYKGLVLIRFARLEEEPRQVPVLKVD
ncbi:MAG: hypothetical protein BMS9Abin34_131 [Patescibacteria group bacterium]|nr:MAG: hypothetical protein BMS9Abin34_131 [Patescibacteria group bacterium]